MEPSQVSVNVNSPLKRFTTTCKTAVGRNRIRFYLKKRAYYRRHQSDPRRTEHLDIFGQLQEEGIVILPNLLDDDYIRQVLDGLAQHVYRVKDGTYAGEHPFIRRETRAMYRLMEADLICDRTRTFFESDMISSIARAYVGPEVKSYQRMIELRSGVGEINHSDYYHFDDWRKRFKAFAYLTDVDEANGPLVYVKRSHRPARWRFREEHHYFKYRKNGRYGLFLPRIVADMCERYNYEEVTCTAARGTVILFDTRGIHRGTPLRKGERLLLGNYFDIRDAARE